VKTLCIDIGNSRIKIGVFKGKRLIKYAEQDTKALLKDNGYFLRFRKLKVEKAIICSVVPRVNKKIVAFVKKTLTVTPLIINETCVLSLPSRYLTRTPLGNDRLVNLYGALCLFKPPFIMVSCGSAVTLDLVAINGIHQGGYILPGLNMSAAALHAFTASLPKVTIRSVKDEFGTDTATSIRAGIIYSTVGGIETLIKRLKKTGKGNVTVIATGGDAPFIKKYCASFDRISKNHTLNALNMILHSL
jgi:type III pantothenate kinase